jgi:Mrp family chromosome partitioning ATPase/uncharacterized protein involved in exopolysaccharide biosynthesis
MDFVYLFRVLLKRKWIIVGAAVIAAVIAYFFVRNKDKEYRSSAQVSTGFAISDEIKVNDKDFSFMEIDTKFSNALVTWTSPPVISLLSYKLILHDLQAEQPFRVLSNEKKQDKIYKSLNKEKAIQIFDNKLTSMSVLNSYNPDEKNLLELLKLYKYDFASISKNLNVYRFQHTDYIQVDFVSENPVLSAYVVNESYHEFLKYYTSVRDRKTQESIDTLQSIMEKKKQELDGKNALLRGEGIVDVNLENSSRLDLIATLEKSLSDEKSKQTQLYYSLRKVNQKLAADQPAAASPNTGGANNDELLSLRKAMNEAYTAYLNSGSSDKALLNRYNQLKTDYQNKVVESNSGTASTTTTDNGASVKELLEQKSDLEVDIEASTANINSLQSKIDNLKGNVASEASKGVAVETLMKEVELANKEYLEAKKKYTDALDITTSSLNNFRQVLYGQPAIEPEPSKKFLMVGMAGAAAMIVTILIITLLTYLDSSIKTPIIFSKTVNLKLISMINFMNLKNKDLAGIISSKDEEEDADNKRHNVFRESLRKLRYEIESSGKKIFLFTSTKKGQGKTTLIQALAFSMSQSKKKILIIDTNFCNNDLTVQLNAEPILEKIDTHVADNHTIIEQVKKLSKGVLNGTVFAIGSEGGDYTPSEILPRENLLQHLHILTSEFDYIFLEGPPLNDFSDSKELVQYVDGVIAVFSANHIIKQIDKESIGFFNELNGKFSGAVLNMVDLNNVNVT